MYPEDILVFLLKIMDACASGVDSRIFVVATVNYAIGFTNSAFFTIQLTHGLLGTIIILLLIGSYETQTDIVETKETVLIRGSTNVEK